MDSSLMTYITIFIGIAVMLGIGTLVLGGAATDCTIIAGYSEGSPTDSTGWASQCLSNNTQSQAGYNLLIITLIVLAAVVVLSVVRMLS